MDIQATWIIWYNKTCSVAIQHLLPIVSTPKTFIERYSPTNKIQAVKHSFLPTSKLTRNILQIPLTDNLTHGTGRVPCLSLACYEFLYLFRMCSHPVAEEIGRRILIMKVNVKFNCFTDKRAKTHIDAHWTWFTTYFSDILSDIYSPISLVVWYVVISLNGTPIKFLYAFFLYFSRIDTPSAFLFRDNTSWQYERISWLFSSLNCIFNSCNSRYFPEYVLFRSR